MTSKAAFPFQSMHLGLQPPSQTTHLTHILTVSRKPPPQAAEAIEALRQSVDTLIIIPNDKLLAAVDPNLPVTEAFRVADDVLRQARQTGPFCLGQSGILMLGV